MFEGLSLVAILVATGVGLGVGITGTARILTGKKKPPPAKPDTND